MADPTNPTVTVVTMESQKHRRRRWRLGTVVGLAALLTTAGIVLAQRNPFGSASLPDPCARPSTGIASPSAAPPAGTGLRVVEKGFTQIGIRGLNVSLGILVENASPLVAYRTRVTFQVRDSRGEAASPRVLPDVVVPVILPGQRIGVGYWSQVREERSRAVGVAGFDVHFNTSQWWPQLNDIHTFASIATSHRSTKLSGLEKETGFITFSFDSDLCRSMASRGVAVLFRDTAGKLIGGSFDNGKGPYDCQPGSSTGFAGASSVPPNFDDSKTVSYPYCDPEPFTPNPLATDRLFN